MKLDPVVIPVDCMLNNKWKLLLNVVSVVKLMPSWYPLAVKVPDVT